MLLLFVTSTHYLPVASPRADGSAIRKDQNTYNSKISIRGIERRYSTTQLSDSAHQYTSVSRLDIGGWGVDVVVGDCCRPAVITSAVSFDKDIGRRRDALFRCC